MIHYQLSKQAFLGYVERMKDNVVKMFRVTKWQYVF